jgi:hypothetical protein
MSSGEAVGTLLRCELARVFGGVRSSELRWFERGRWAAKTTTRVAGRCNTAEDRARRRCGLAYGDEHGEQ